MSDFLDKAKDMASDSNLGGKLPDGVSDHVEKVIPGDSDGDGH